MSKKKEGFVGKMPNQSDNSEMDFFLCPECGHDKTGLRVGRKDEGNGFTFLAFAECHRCGHLFPAPEHRTNLNPSESQTPYRTFQRRVAERLASVLTSRPQRRRLEKAIKSNRSSKILEAASEIGPEVKEAILDAQRSGWAKRGFRFVLRFLKYSAALVIAGVLTTGAAYVTEAVLDALDTEAAIEGIVDSLIEKPGNDAYQHPNSNSNTIDPEKEADGSEVSVGKPVDV